MLPMQRCLIKNKLISVNYWFGCDWCICEVGYHCLRAGQLSLTCAVVYMWNTGYVWVACLRRKPGIQHTPHSSAWQETGELGLLVGMVGGDKQNACDCGVWVHAIL